MRIFTRLVKKFVTPALWSHKILGKEIVYYGGDADVFMREFEQLEDHIIALWDNNQLTWEEYQISIAEIQRAKQQFAWSVY
jgi:hypothetical protein